MKYQQRNFTNGLLEKIKNTELVLNEHMEVLLSENKSVFAKKNLDFYAEFFKEGENPFEPGYSSSVSIGIAEENEGLFDIHTINIWECKCSFLGIQISKNIPGSKIIGELVDESLVEIKLELKEYMDDLLED